MFHVKENVVLCLSEDKSITLIRLLLPPLYQEACQSVCSRRKLLFHSFHQTVDLFIIWKWTSERTSELHIVFIEMNLFYFLSPHLLNNLKRVNILNGFSCFYQVNFYDEYFCFHQLWLCGTHWELLMLKHYRNSFSITLNKPSVFSND